MVQCLPALRRIFREPVATSMIGMVSKPNPIATHGNNNYMLNTRKTTQDLLQEDLMRERVSTLARAGERLTDALERLRSIEKDLTEVLVLWYRGAENGGKNSQRLLTEANEKICAYNRQREQVKTCYYYLIVTREALGIIHHERLEEIYRIPTKKYCLPEQ
jgi:hypothetical protein